MGAQHDVFIGPGSTTTITALPRTGAGSLSLGEEIYKLGAQDGPEFNLLCYYRNLHANEIKQSRCQFLNQCACK